MPSVDVSFSVEVDGFPVHETIKTIEYKEDEDYESCIESAKDEVREECLNTLYVNYIVIQHND